ncbi:MAG TPA: type II toxin-antitoxin system prevent-host-death family antitoxin [Vicinamibacteria bacterium]
MTSMGKERATSVSVADAKREFSDLLGRVAYGGESILITRRGRPMARLVPIDQELGEGETPGAGIRGWLDDDDPFFEIVDEIVAARARHKPRVLGRSRSRESKRGRD